MRQAFCVSPKWIFQTPLGGIILPVLQTLMGNLDSQRSSEFPVVTEWGSGGAWIETLAFLQAPARSTFHILSILPPTKQNCIFLLCLLVGIKRLERDSWQQYQNLEAHRPKEYTHRLCKSVVPENSGRRIVVLAAVDNHHHREGQGLKKTQEQGWAPAAPRAALLPFFSITTRLFSLQVSVNVTLEYRIGRAPGIMRLCTLPQA